MPQVHNQSQGDSTFGSDSRYMKALRFTDMSIRRVNVLNALEKKQATKQLEFFQSDSAFKMQKMDRIRYRLEDNMNKRMAYKLVLKTKTFSAQKDSEKALNKRYTLAAFQTDVREMLRLMKPDNVRDRKTKQLRKDGKLKYNFVLSQTKKQFDALVPDRNTWIPRGEVARMREAEEAKRKAEQERKRMLEQTAPLPNIEARSKRGLATLRRRVITIDPSPVDASPRLATDRSLKLPPLNTPTPRSPASTTPTAQKSSRNVSPVKTPAIGNPPSSNVIKRQGITMNMMKKQKSFIETQERTLTPTEFAKSLHSDRSEKTKTPRTAKSDKSPRKVEGINNEPSNMSPHKKETSLPLSSGMKRGGSKFNKNQPTLPPIESHRTPRDESVSSDASTRHAVKSVKLPSLKMTSDK